MFPFKKFRKILDIDIKGSFEGFLNENFKGIKIAQIKSLIDDFIQSRNTVGYLDITNLGREKLKLNIENSLRYIDFLNQLSSKLNFGKKNGEVKLKFRWKDVLGEKETSSYNIYYEISSVYYNLGICYLYLGNIDLFSKDTNQLKDSLNNYEKAASCFKTVRNYKITNIKTDSNDLDLGEDYLSLCVYFSLAYAQMSVVNFLKGSPKLETKTEYSYGIYNMFNTIISTKIEKNPFQNDLCKFYRDFYEALAFSYKKDILFENFNKSGKGIGIALGYCDAALENLTKIESFMLNNSKYVDTDFFNEISTNLVNFTNKNKDLNIKIYREGVLNRDELPEIKKSYESVKAKDPSETFPKITSVALLNTLITQDIQHFVDNYLINMKNFIQATVNEYETEEKVNAYLSQNLSTQSSNKRVSITDEMFNELQFINSRGGFDYILSQVNVINSNQIKARNDLNSVSEKLFNETEEDNKYRLLYQNKWSLPPIDIHISNKRNEFEKNLNIAMEIDRKVMNKIHDNSKYFELVKLPRNILEERLTVSSTHSSVGYSQKLQNALNDIDKNKKEISQEIANIYQYVTNNVPLTDFTLISKKLTNENVILANQKKLLESKFKKLEEISNKIKECYNTIEQENYNAMESSKSSIQVNEDYMNFLKSASQKFNELCKNLKQSQDFYANFQKKITTYSSDLDSYLFARNLSKTDLLEYLDKNFKRDLANA